MSAIQNPYRNVDQLGPQPDDSVVDKVKDNENIYIEEAGLNAYNFVNLGNELNAFQDVQNVHRSAFPPNRTNEFNIDTTNRYFPHIQPLFYKGVASNNALLNNPPKHNQNLDMESQRTYIKPFYTKNEEPGTLLPIEVGKYSTKLPLGPVYLY